MSLLSRFRVLTKILMVIGLLSACAIGITYLGVTSLKSLSDATDVMERATKLALSASRINQEVLQMNRGEYRLGTEPTPQIREEVRRNLDDRKREIEAQLSELKKISTVEDTKRRIAEMESVYERYKDEVIDTFKVAEGIKNIDSSAEMNALRKSLASSRVVSSELQEKGRDLAAMLTQRVLAVSAEATNEYLRVSNMMITVASIGITVGLLFGFLIGQFGIAKPIAAWLPCSSAWPRVKTSRSPAPSARTKSAKPLAPSTRSRSCWRKRPASKPRRRPSRIASRWSA